MLSDLSPDPAPGSRLANAAQPRPFSAGTRDGAGFGALLARGKGQDSGIGTQAESTFPFERIAETPGPEPHLEIRRDGAPQDEDPATGSRPQTDEGCLPLSELHDAPVHLAAPDGNEVAALTGPPTNAPGIPTGAGRNGEAHPLQTKAVGLDASMTADRRDSAPATVLANGTTPTGVPVPSASAPFADAPQSRRLADRRATDRREATSPSPTSEPDRRPPGQPDPAAPRSLTPAFPLPIAPSLPERLFASRLSGFSPVIGGARDFGGLRGGEAMGLGLVAGAGEIAPLVPTDADAARTGRGAGTAAEQAREIAQQIGARITPLARGQFEMVLAPAELGRLEIALREIDGVMTLSVTAERPETLELIRRHVDLLAQELRLIAQRDLSLQLGADGSGARSGRGPEHQAANGRADAAPSVSDLDPLAAARNALAQDQLDLRL